MQTIKFQNEEDWKEFRKGRIGGTRTHGIKPKSIGKYGVEFYELLAERVSVPEEAENPMTRGNRLEDVAVQAFIEATKEELGYEYSEPEKVVWVSDLDDRIYVSPDKVIDKETAIEVKCLKAAHHLCAHFTKDYPHTDPATPKYKSQARKYFAVNPDLQTLWVVFYNPSVPTASLVYFKVTREDVQKDAEAILLNEQTVLAEIDRLEALLNPF